MQQARLGGERHPDGRDVEDAEVRAGGVDQHHVGLDAVVAQGLDVGGHVVALRLGLVGAEVGDVGGAGRGVVQGLAEGIHFAKRAGLDVETVIATISKGAAQSWQMENRYKTMNDGKFDFGFAVDWMRKDLGICLSEARRNGAQLPVAALVDQFYGEVQKMGGKRWDTSSLIARLER